MEKGEKHTDLPREDHVGSSSELLTSFFTQVEELNWYLSLAIKASFKVQQAHISRIQMSWMYTCPICLLQDGKTSKTSKQHSNIAFDAH